MNKTTRNIVTAAVIGALYAVLTMVLAPISYGPVQCRISEVLCILPFFMPSTTWGTVFRMCYRKHCKRGRTAGYHLRLACNAYSMPVHIVVRKAQ